MLIVLFLSKKKQMEANKDPSQQNKKKNRREENCIRSDKQCVVRENFNCTKSALEFRLALLSVGKRAGDQRWSRPRPEPGPEQIARLSTGADFT